MCIRDRYGPARRDHPSHRHELSTQTRGQRSLMSLSLCRYSSPRPTRYDAARGAQGVPSFRSPEAAVYALAKAAEYAEWRTRPPGVVPELDGIDADRAREIVEAELAAAPQGRWLSPARMVELFGCYGVRVWPTVVAASVEEAATTVGHTRTP